MNFELSEQQRMLKKTTKDFVEKEIAPIAAEIDRSGEFSSSLSSYLILALGKDEQKGTSRSGVWF